MSLLFILFCIIFATFLTFSTFYHLFFAFVYFYPCRKNQKSAENKRKFLILIPAHNEETLIGRLIDSLKQLNYPKEKYKVAVIADNCTDKTAPVAEGRGANVLIRNEPAKRGKGFALQWAFGRDIHKEFEAVLIIDADNIVDSNLLLHLNNHLERGERVIQCNNGLSNPDETWFTRIAYIATVINNRLFFHGRYKLGLSAILDGNGMCFDSNIINQYGWMGQSISEDKEYSVHLIQESIFIDFAVEAKVYAQESRSLNQAFSQRLRWSGGKFRHGRKYGLKLLSQGLKEKNFKKMDAVLPLLLPSQSLQINLTLFALLLTLIPLKVNFQSSLQLYVLLLILLQFLYLTLGFVIARASIKVVTAFVFAPVFLLWKAFIDLLSFFGYKNQIWVRTKRPKEGRSAH